MLTTRREFLHTVSAMSAIGFLPRIARSAWGEPGLHFANKPLRDRAFVIGELNSGGNVLTVPSQLGPIVVDSKFSHTALDLVAEVQSLMKARPALLVGSSRVDLQACKLEYSIVSPK